MSYYDEDEEEDGEVENIPGCRVEWGVTILGAGKRIIYKDCLASQQYVCVH